MILFSLCTSSAGLKTLLILKITLQIICTIIPLVIMYRAFAAMLKNVKEGGKEIGKDVGNVFKNLIAGLIIFLIPVMINYTFHELLDSDIDFVGCINDASLEKIKEAEEREAAEALAKKKAEEEEALRISKEMLEKRKQKILETYRKRLEQGWHCAPLDYSYEGNGTVKAEFSSKTLRIVEKHMNDVNNGNFFSVINSYGGFDKYMKSLGGVFSKYYGRELNIDSPCDLQDVSEYVFGMMVMYGFDYRSDEKYCKWGGKCMHYADLEKAKQENKLDTFVYPSGTSDAFYPGTYRDESGYGSSRHFDALISGKNGLHMTSNCSATVDKVYYKAGVYGKQFPGISSGSQKAALQAGGILIDKVSDLAVGDVIHFFHNSIDRNDPSTWSGWYHVAFIGEIDKKAGKVIGYDGGSYLQLNRNYKWKADINGDTLMGNKNWAAIRLPIGLDEEQLEIFKSMK